MDIPTSSVNSFPKESTDSNTLSIVIPCYNECENLQILHARLLTALKALPFRIEVIYVDDGSKDDTANQVRMLDSTGITLRLITLSRNFGKEIAITAGLEHTNGDAAIVIDADLQDPPEVIPLLVAEWQAGFDVVYAQRTLRHGESWLKTLTAKAFYRVIRVISRSVDIPKNTGDFRLLSRRAIDALLLLREHHRFMKGLFSWIGFPQKAVIYERDPRYAGASKWNYWTLWNFSLDGITSFSTAPLRIATYVGACSAVLAFVYGVYIAIKAMLFGDSVQGYPSLMVVITFLGGVQLVTMGIIGEYLGRTFNEAKQRPLYFVQEDSVISQSADSG
jgi:glycosyltransferase involved in cell wall biosynthesis